jgi:hypothetical protein
MRETGLTVGNVTEEMSWSFGAVPLSAIGQVVLSLVINLLILIPAAVGCLSMSNWMERGRNPLLVVFASRATMIGALCAIPLAVGIAALVDVMGLGLGWALIMCFVMINFGAVYALGLGQIARWVRQWTQRVLQRRRYKALVGTPTRR